MSASKIRFVPNRHPGLIFVEKLGDDGLYGTIGFITRARKTTEPVVKKGDRVFLETVSPTNPKFANTPGHMRDPNYYNLKKAVIERHS